MVEAAEYIQKGRIFWVNFDGSEDTFLLDGFRGKEGISQPFRFTLDLFAKNPEKRLPPDQILHKEMGLRILLPDEEVREINGVVSGLRELGFDADMRFRYQAEIVPWCWFLSLTRNSRIFQDKTPLEIIKEVFGKYPDLTFDASKVSSRQTPREYCVQYRESDLAFATRLMEEEGIFYFFEHKDGKHTMVLSDGSAAFEKCAQPEVGQDSYRPGEDHIEEAEREHRVHPGEVTLTDFDPLNPSFDLESTASGDSPFRYPVFDHPGNYVDTGRGEAYARIRAEEDRALRDILRGSGNCRAFQTGRQFRFYAGNHPYFDRDWVLLSVEHTGNIGGYRSGLAEAEYSNRFQCIPADAKFRPARATPRPRIQSSQTAIVTGPSGEEIYTDEDGRVKVHFHWDRYNSPDENSSCWLRVAQLWAGAQWGGLFLPRIGQEVIVNFLEGDPDRPIVTGCVYNGMNLPGLDLPAKKTQSHIKSDSSKGGGGFNEIRFEDKAGEELLYFHAQKDREVEVQNDNRETVHNDETITVDANQTLEVGADRKVTVAADHQEDVGGKQALSIGGDREMSVGANLDDTIGGNRTVSVGGDESTSITGKMALDVGSDSTVSITGKGDVSVIGDASLSGIGAVEISAVKELKLSCGAASITLKSTGDVEVKGLNVKVDGAMKTDVTAGLKLTLKGVTSGIN